jgi:hypothetical protein
MENTEIIKILRKKTSEERSAIILKALLPKDKEERRVLIVNLLAQQRKKYKGKKQNYIRDFTTLIDLSTGLIVGSGVCPACKGWLGRAEHHED